MSTNYYKRSVEFGNGMQFVEVMDGTIRAQWLARNQDHYEGDGNPELIGEDKKALRGMGFKKCSQSESDYLLETTE